MLRKLSRRRFVELFACPAFANASESQASPRQASGRKVLVAGAGLAGMSAAYELEREGHEVIVIEARPRVGGRVLTLHTPFSDGLYAEAGPVAFSDHHPLVLEYAKTFDLTVEPILPRDHSARYFVRGKHLIVPENGIADWPLELTSEERRLGLYGIVQRYTASGLRALGDPTGNAWPSAAQMRFDQITFAQYLSAQGASPGAIKLLRPMYDMWGDGIDHVSALFLLRDLAIGMTGNQWYTFKGGNDVLPKAFAAKLSDKIMLNTPIKKIQHDSRGLTLTVSQQGRTRNLTGDYLICTLPFSVLRGLEISPPFSTPKREAIAELPYTSVARVYLQANRRFWLDDGPRGWTYTDLPIMNVLESTWSQPGRRGIMHTYMAAIERGRSRE